MLNFSFVLRLTRESMLPLVLKIMIPFLVDGDKCINIFMAIVK